MVIEVPLELTALASFRAVKRDRDTDLETNKSGTSRKKRSEAATGGLTVHLPGHAGFKEKILAAGTPMSRSRTSVLNSQIIERFIDTWPRENTPALAASVAPTAVAAMERENRGFGPLADSVARKMGRHRT